MPIPPVKKSAAIPALVFMAAVLQLRAVEVDFTITVHSEVASESTAGVPATPNFTTLPTTKATYVQWREALLEFARMCAGRGLSWNFQSDWNFLEGVYRYEIAAPGNTAYDPAIANGTYSDNSTGLRSTNTGGKNVVRYLSENLSVSLDPHSHETGGYNYADIAYVLEQKLGATATKVVGGHVYGGAGYQNWPKFLAAGGLAASKYNSANYTWKPEMLMGGATASHASDPHVSGLWRPSIPPDPDPPATDTAYFTHNASTDIVAAGGWEQDFHEIDRLLHLVESGRVQPAGRLVVGRVFNHRDFVQPGYLASNATALLDTVKAWRDSGRFTVRTWKEILDFWKSNPTPSQYLRPPDNLGFSLNWQDFSYPEKSIEELRTLLDHHESTGVPVDVFFTTWQTDIIEQQAPDLLGRLRSSAVVNMGYHVRPPKPYANNYSLWWTLQNRTLTATDIANYETLSLNMTTGESIPGTSGGYAKISALFEYAPPVVGSSNGNSTIRALISNYFSGAGASLSVVHRDATAVNLGEMQDGMYLRPESHDWILIETFSANAHLGTTPAYAVETSLSLARTSSNATAPYFVGIKLHDNDLFATQSAWTKVYQDAGKVPPWNTSLQAALLESSDPAEPGRRRDFYKNLVAEAAARAGSQNATVNLGNARDTLSLLGKEAPRPLAMDHTSVPETSAGTALAKLSGGGVESGVLCTYSLVSGNGSDDNALFTISNSTLSSAAPLDFETHPVNKLRLRWTDGGGNSGERALTLVLSNIDSDDDDGDGFTEAQETAAGTDPLDAASLLRITASSIGPTSALVSFASIPSKSYLLETSTDLAAWEPVHATTANATTTTLAWSTSNSTDQKRFFRVKVGN